MLNDADKDAIRQQVEYYFNGSYYANEDELRTCFHPNAIIAGTFDGQYVEWNLDGFIERILNAQSFKKDPFLKEILMIEGIKDMSLVKTRVLVNDIIFFDYISLVKINGVWLIRYKSFVNVKDEESHGVS